MIGQDHLHIIEKGGGARIEPFGTLYFNVPVSEKTSIHTKIIRKQKYFIFPSRTPK